MKPKLKPQKLVVELVITMAEPMTYKAIKPWLESSIGRDPRIAKVRVRSVDEDRK